ncbi:MAG: hypothetical protein JJU02_00320 [Cryomorphaceae bacterium]|nr:hypothetical protein [Cryomorphaceae bacterium]
MTENNESSKPIEVIDFDRDFNEWLTNVELKKRMIVDTTGERAFELWAYSDKLTKSDSAFYWHPSKDSSYFLITNFNRETKNRIRSEYTDGIVLRFLKADNQEIYIGMMLLDSMKQRSIDFYWYDSTTFFFIVKEEAKKERTLTKLKMGIDSIWTYKIEK